MISAVAGQNSNKRPSFTMKFGPKMQGIFDSEFSAGKLNRKVIEAYNSVIDDRTTDFISVDIAENPKFPYHQNSQITPRFFLNIVSSNAKKTNNSLVMLGEDKETIGLSFKCIVDFISKKTFPDFVMNKLPPANIKPQKIETPAVDVAHKVKNKRQSKEIIEADVKHKIPSKINNSSEIDEFVQCPRVVALSDSYIGVGRNFKQFFDYRKSSELLSEQDVNTYKSIIRDPRYEGISFDVERSKTASKGNRPIKYSLILHNEDKTFRYADKDGANLFEFGEILEILDSEKFLLLMGK